jgi:hypothetical protein
MAAYKRPQFSLAALMSTLSAGAVILVCAVIKPTIFTGWIGILATVSLPAFLTVAAIKKKGYARTFCIGALFPACFALIPAGIFLFYMIDQLTDNRVMAASTTFTITARDMPLIDFRLGWILAWPPIPLVGVLCVLLDWRLGHAERES